METNVNYTIVGIFVITIISMVILAIIWLSSGLSTQTYSIYKVLMQESVSGLSPDSVVEYNGVNVGSVSSIEINKKNPQIVELLLKINSSTPITQGTTAMLKAKGLTGIGFIALSDKGTDKTPLAASPGEKYPIIKTVPSFFLQLDTALRQFSVNFRKLSDNVANLLDQENLNSLRSILLNLKDLTGNLSANRPQINAILNNASRATEQLSPAIQSFSLNTLPQANDTIGNLNSAATNLDAVSQEIKQNPAILIRGKAQRTLGPGER
jgi:phospholipid/cholesterol/gamma-HCH transport system substrate-binding protein